MYNVYTCILPSQEKKRVTAGDISGPVGGMGTLPLLTTAPIVTFAPPKNNRNIVAVGISD